MHCLGGAAPVKKDEKKAEPAGFSFGAMQSIESTLERLQRLVRAHLRHRMSEGAHPHYEVPIPSPKEARKSEFSFGAMQSIESTLEGLQRLVRAHLLHCMSEGAHPHYEVPIPWPKWLRKMDDALVEEQATSSDRSRTEIEAAVDIVLEEATTMSVELDLLKTIESGFRTPLEAPTTKHSPTSKEGYIMKVEKTYILKVAAHLRRVESNKQFLHKIALVLPKPPHLPGKLKSILMRWPMYVALDFSPYPHVNDFLVSLVSDALSHKFEDATYGPMFSFLFHLQQLFGTRTWPMTKDQLKSPLKTMCSDDKGSLAVSCFHQLQHEKYVEVQSSSPGSSSLRWNQPLIQDAIAKMPLGLKGLVVWNSSGEHVIEDVMAEEFGCPSIESTLEGLQRLVRAHLLHRMSEGAHPHYEGLVEEQATSSDRSRTEIEVENTIDSRDSELSIPVGSTMGLHRVETKQTAIGRSASGNMNARKKKPVHIVMLVDKCGMVAGTCAEIVSESGGAHTQWRLSNGRAVNKNQVGKIYQLHPGSAPQDATGSSEAAKTGVADAGGREGKPMPTAPDGGGGGPLGGDGGVVGGGGIGVGVGVGVGGVEGNAEWKEPHVVVSLEEISKVLMYVTAADPVTRVPPALAITCKGVPQSLDLITIAMPQKVFVFDCVRLGVIPVCAALQPLLEAPSSTKFLHNANDIAWALSMHGKIHTLRGLIDTQLAAEHMWGEGSHLKLDDFLARMEMNLPEHLLFLNKLKKLRIDWSTRPLPLSNIKFACEEVSLLHTASVAMRSKLGADCHIIIQPASDTRAAFSRANDGASALCFDVANDYAEASPELLKLTRPGDFCAQEPLAMDCEMDELIRILPVDLQHRLKAVEQPNGWDPMRMFSMATTDPVKPVTDMIDIVRLVDIVLDKGRQPHCWVGTERVFFAEDKSRVVTESDITSVMSNVGSLGSDHRAALDGKLHRISAMVNREGHVSGLTMRVGRCILGNASMIMDLLMGSDKSILILGEPGSGKTTIVREIARILSMERNVCVIDTSNEIAGDGDIPHHCIGFARRMMVPSLDKQSDVMVECVQNHTPHVMVIDEIGRPKEVNAARTVKQRGVRIISSAHGDLRRLVKNTELRGLIGGVESVTMGDAMARDEAKRKGHSGVSKVQAQRAGEPTFDIIIQLRRGAHNEWAIINDCAVAVDAILDGKKFQTQTRNRDAESGALRMNVASS